MSVRSVCLCVDNWPKFSMMHGPVRYVQTLAKGMVERGVAVHILTPVKRPEKAFEEDGYWVHPCLTKRLPVASRFQPGLGETWGLWRALEALRRTHSIDVVEFTNVEGLGAAAAVFSSLPVVVRVHTTAFEALSLGIGKQHLERGYARLERFTAHRAVGLVTHSLAHRDQCAIDYSVEPSRIAVIPHGVVPVGAPGSVSRSPNQILSVGAASLRKGIDFFLAVAGRVVQMGLDAQFVWAGRDSRSAPGGLSWREYAANTYPELAGKLRFENDVQDAELGRLYAESAVYFCAARYESFGLTLVEAMQARTPLLVPDEGAMKEIVGDGEAGLMYAPQDVESAACQLASLLTDVQLARDLGERGFLRAEREFSAGVMTERVLTYYEELIQQRASR